MMFIFGYMVGRAATIEPTCHGQQCLVQMLEDIADGPGPLTLALMITGLVGLLIGWWQSRK